MTDLASELRALAATLGWRSDMENAPLKEPLLFANFDVVCLLSGIPHVWGGRYFDLDHNGKREMFEASLAATHDNGEPTHWRKFPDTPDPTAALLERCADEIVQLREALVDTSASLAAAISLLERSPKTAAPSNKMFDQMLVDYRASFERARRALNGENNG